MKQYSTLDMQGNEIVNCPSLNGDGGDANLTEEIVSNVAVGGAPSGTKFDKDMEFTEFAKKLLRTDIEPTISFSASGASSLHEVGTTVNGSTLTLNITNLNAVTFPVNTIVFKKGSTVLDTQQFVPGTSQYQFSYSGAITEATTFTAVLTYSGSKTKQGSAAIDFAYPRYYGAVGANNPTDATGLMKAALAKSKSFTWTNANLVDQRYCYMYPSSLGTLSSIKDANNFEYIQSYETYTLTIDSVQYRAYVLKDPVTITGAKQAYA